MKVLRGSGLSIGKSLYVDKIFSNDENNIRAAGRVVKRQLCDCPVWKVDWRDSATKNQPILPPAYWAESPRSLESPQVPPLDPLCPLFPPSHVTSCPLPPALQPHRHAKP